jgi:hypothetical protein
MTGGALSHYASEYPDGLEWSIAKMTGQRQQKEEKRPEKNKVSTPLSGIVGGTITLALCGVIGFALKRRVQQHAPRG